MKIIDILNSLRKDKQTTSPQCSFCDAEAVGLSLRYVNTTNKEIPIQDCEKIITYYCKEHQPKEGIST